MTMEAADALALADAVRRLEHPGPGVRLASLLGSPVREGVGRLVEECREAAEMQSDPCPP